MKKNMYLILAIICLFAAGCTAEERVGPAALIDMGVYAFTAVDYEAREIRQMKLGGRGSVVHTKYYLLLESEDGTYGFYEPVESSVEALYAIHGSFGTSPPLIKSIQVFEDETGAAYFFDEGTSSEMALTLITEGVYLREQETTDGPVVK